MLELKTTMNPDAMEIVRDGKTIGTIRRRGNTWDLWVPEKGDGATVVQGDVVVLVAGFIDLARKDQEGG